MAAASSLPMGTTKMKSGSISMIDSRLKSLSRLGFSSARFLAPRSTSMAPVIVEDACTRVPPEYVVSTSAEGASPAGTLALTASMRSDTAWPFCLYRSSRPVTSQQVRSMRR